MTHVNLWDKNGIVCMVDEDDVEDFCKRNEHREFSTEKKPINLGWSKRRARSAFIGNRIASLRRRWSNNHDRAVTDAMLAGDSNQDAHKIADDKWGAAPPTPKAIAEELADEIPESMREEA